MNPTPAQLLAQVETLAAELDSRARHCRIVESYFDGHSPLPLAVTEAKVTRAYRRLMPAADAPWGTLVVGSVLDRLEVGGIRDQDSKVADIAWGLWQENHMDAESKLAHSAGLVSGRAFALTWPDQTTGRPEISLDTAEQMIVQYEEGSRHKRRAALRRWQDADTNLVMATLYRPEAIYKLQQSNERENASWGPWAPRLVDGEDWPVANPFNVVPVVEIRFNPRLRPGQWGYARGEYAHCLGLIDRINLLTFLGLVVAFWQGFPIRAVIGDRILRDDDGNVIQPFEATADSIVQFENPAVKLDTFAAADRGNLSVYPELAQLAAITKTPRHYFPLAQAMSNLSADAIRADEGALNAKVIDHKASAGEGWEEVLRLCGLMVDAPLSPRAELVWLDHESRSLAERADAASKLAAIMPWQILAERVLNATQDEIARWEALRAGDALSQLVAAATSKPPAAGANGNTPALAPTPMPTSTPTPGVGMGIGNQTR
jgi:Phage portal protein, SPP1 Gp6-like